MPNYNPEKLKSVVLFVLFVSVSFVFGGENSVLTRIDSSITRLNLNSIAHGNGQFVVVGRAGIVLRSPDGLDWERRTAPVELMSIVYAEPYFLAVGQDRALYRSDFGVEWEKIRDLGSTDVRVARTSGLYFLDTGSGVERSIDLEAWEPVESLLGFVRWGIYENSFWIHGRLASDPNVWEVLRSSDGLDWVVSTPITSGTNLLGISGNRIYVERLGNVFTSTDGEDWQRVGSLNIGHQTSNFVPLPDNGFIAHNSVNTFVNWGDYDLRHLTLPNWKPNAFAANNERIVAVGDMGGLAFKERGKGWQTVNMPIPSADYQLVPVGDHWILAASRQRMILHSADGVTWSEQMLPDMANGSQYRIFPAETYALLIAARQFNSNSAFYRSENGLDWTETAAFDVDFPLNHFAWGDVMVVEAVDGAFYYTRDGLDWEVLVPPAESEDGEIVVGPAGLYWVEEGSGFWYLAAGSDFSDGIWISAPGLQSLAPGEEFVLAEISLGWRRIWHDQEISPDPIPVRGTNTHVIWADGYFWQLINGTQVIRSLDGSSWEDVYESDSQLALHLAGDLYLVGSSVIYRESLLNTSDNRYWSSSDGLAPVEDVALIEPRDYFETVVNDPVTIELAVDGDASSIDRIELLLGNRVLETSAEASFQWELSFEAAGRYEIRIRVYYRDGRTQVLEDSVGFFVQLTDDRSLADNAPESITAHAVFKDKLFFATGDSNDGAEYWVTLDGENWQVRTVPVISSITDFLVTEDLIIARATPYIYAVSQDGVTWRQMPVQKSPVYSDGKILWRRSDAAWSEDGVVWFDSGLNDRVETVAYHNGAHYIETAFGNFSSTDRIDWNKKDYRASYWKLSDNLYRLSASPTGTAHRLDDTNQWSLVGTGVDGLRDFAFADGSYYQLGNPSKVGYSLDSMHELGMAGDDLDGFLVFVIEFNGVVWMGFGGNLSSQPVPLGQPSSTQAIPELVSSDDETDWVQDVERSIDVELMVPEEGSEYVRWYLNGDDVTDSVGSGLTQTWQAEDWGVYEIRAEWSADGETWLSSNALIFRIGVEREWGVLDGPRFYRDEFYPLTDRAIMHVGDDHIFSMDGISWFYLDPEEVLFSREIRSTFSNRFGSLARTDSELLISPDHLFWYTLDGWLEAENYTWIETRSSVVLIKDQDTGKIHYLDLLRFDSGAFEAPRQDATIHYAERMENGRWFLQSDSELYLQDDAGDWQEPFVTGVMPLQVAGDLLWGWHESANVLFVARDVRHWQEMTLPLSVQRVHGYYNFNGVHYLLAGNSSTADMIYNSLDGDNWVEGGSVDFRDPFLFEINGALMVYQFSRSIQLSWIDSPPEPLSEEEFNLRLYFFPMVKDDFFRLIDPYGQMDPFIGTEAGWVWHQELGWLWPSAYGYPFYLFWSERHEGWLLTDHDNSQYWYSFKMETWGYLYSEGDADPWRPMPEQLGWLE